MARTCENSDKVSVGIAPGVEEIAIWSPDNGVKLTWSSTTFGFFSGEHGYSMRKDDDKRHMMPKRGAAHNLALAVGNVEALLYLVPHTQLNASTNIARTVFKFV